MMHVQSFFRDGAGGGGAAEPRVSDLIAMWRGTSNHVQSIEWQRRGWQMPVSYARIADQILALCGDVPIAFFDDTRAQGLVLHWHNQYGDRRASADMMMIVLRSLFNFGRKIGLLRHNPAKGIKPRYSARFELFFWTDPELDRFDDCASDMGLPEVGVAVRLMGLTGLMPGKVTCLTFEHVGDKCLERPFPPEKKPRGVPALPLLLEAKVFIAELQRRNRESSTETILVTKSGHPWKAAHLTDAIKKVQGTAAITHVDWSSGSPVAVQKKARNLPKSWAVKLMKQGATDDEIVFLTHWYRDDVRDLRNFAGLGPQKSLAPLKWTSALQSPGN